MTTTKKCPNCGYETTDNLDYCPNCDQFETRRLAALTVEEVAKMNARSEKQQKNEDQLAATLQEGAPLSVDATTETALPHEEELAVNIPVVPPAETDAEITVPTEAPVAEELETFVPATTPEIPDIDIEVPEIAIEMSEIATAMPKAAVEMSEIATATPEVPVEEKPITPKVSAVATQPEPTNPAVAVTEGAAPQAKAKKSHRGIVTGLVLLGLLFGGGAFYLVKQQQEVKHQAQVEQTVKEAKLATEKLFADASHDFLSAALDAAKLKEVETSLQNLPAGQTKTDLEILVAEAKTKLAAQEALNKLFQTPVVSGNELNAAALIQPTLTAIPDFQPTDQSPFSERLQAGYAEAGKQLSLNQNAAKYVGVVFKDKVQDQATKANLEQAKQAVKDLKDSTLQKKYQSQLAEVEKTLKAKEVAAEKAAKEKAAATVQQAVSSTPVNGQAVTTQANKNSIHYVTVPEEGAWAWAPGVKEQVLGESLGRGYIVEGGYVLRQKEVINGEGYYDLYATTTASKLLKNRSQSELPIYLVTINAKTGWFKGEGPN